MLYLYKNQSNNIVLTLDEKATNSTHDWLFEFTNDITNAVKYATLSDISTTPLRFNEFNLIEPDDVLLQEGSWTYRVYEMPVASPPSTNPNLAYGIVEVGKVWVEDVTVNVVDSFDEDENEEQPTFE